MVNGPDQLNNVGILEAEEDEEEYNNNNHTEECQICTRINKGIN